MNLVNCLHALNDWWNTQTVDTTYLYKRTRSEFSVLVKNIGGEKLLALTGPKGCGKTTLLYQTVDYLIRKNIAPVRILLIAGYEPSLSIQDAELSKILKTYASSVLHEPLESLTQPVYVFIDEVHWLPDWQESVKDALKNCPLVHFILSAPTKELIFLENTEELVPRSLHIHIPSLSPAQFIEMHGTYRKSDFDNITCKSLLPHSRLFDNPRKYVTELMETIEELAAFQKGRTALIQEYLLAGGYPGYFSCGGVDAWHRRLTDELIDLSLYNDILCNYRIKVPESLKVLLFLAASENGREQSFSQISDTLSLNTTTVVHHLEILSDGGFVTLCENYSEQNPGESRKKKRIYLRDCGMRNALTRCHAITPENLEDELRHALVSMASEFVIESGGNVSFWRSHAGEADIVIDKGDSLLPILISLDNRLSKKEVRGLNSFGKNFANRDTLVITQDLLEIENHVCYLPYWLL